MRPKPLTASETHALQAACGGEISPQALAFAERVNARLGLITGRGLDYNAVAIIAEVSDMLTADKPPAKRNTREPATA